MNNIIMSKTQLSILAVALALSGCTMIPKYERPVAPVAAQYPGATESQKESAASDIAWQNFFAEERLKKLIELALANNRRLPGGHPERRAKPRPVSHYTVGIISQR